MWLLASGKFFNKLVMGHHWPVRQIFSFFPAFYINNQAVLSHDNLVAK
jgi:hypothetical protein